VIVGVGGLLVGIGVTIADRLPGTPLQLASIKADTISIRAIFRNRDVIHLERRFIDWFFS
jgi:hypothetical protein